MNTKMLLPIAATIILAVAVACSGNEPQPTTEPGRNEQGPSQTIEAMTQELAALKTETAGSQSNPDGPRPTASIQPTSRIQPTQARSTPTPEPTTPPTAIVIAPPTGPGICGRTPEIQKKILYNLDVKLCQVIAIPELFRITELSDLTVRAPRPGDFEGLTNLEHLELTVQDIPADAFLGLENLKTMELTIYSDGSISPGGFRGLNNLELLRIRTSKPDSSQEDTLVLLDFDSIPNLKYLYVDQIPELYVETITESLLQGLPRLEGLSIKLRTQEYEREDATEISLPAKLLANNPNLKSVEILQGQARNARVQIPQDFFEGNPDLEWVKFRYRQIHIPSTTFKHLDKLEGIRLEEVADKERPELELSERSPLFNRILYGSESPYGYTLAGEKDD